VRVCDLIGGCARTRIPAYASTGFFSDDPTDSSAHDGRGGGASLRRHQDQDWPRHRQRRGARAQAREAIGPDKLLLVDINGAYTPDVALECARAIEPFGIHWIEEPCPGRPQGLCGASGAFADPARRRRSTPHVRDFKR